jgi:anti-anti-sigma factor
MAVAKFISGEVVTEGSKRPAKFINNLGRRKGMVSKGMAMHQATRSFEIECKGETLILTPLTNLGELAFQPMEAEANAILELLVNSSLKNVVVDFHRTDYFGTTVLAYCLKLWQRVRSQGGHMAFCNVSDHEMEILRWTKLDTLWTICGSREEAMETVRS